MRTALVLAAAATLSCTLAFVPPAPVVRQQRSAVRYVLTGMRDVCVCWEGEWRGSESLVRRFERWMTTQEGK